MTRDILVADGEPAIRTLVTRAREHGGYTLRQAGDARSAMQARLFHAR